MSNCNTQPSTPPKSSQKMIFSIEGNIGAGKSTFLSILNKQLDIDFQYFPENIDSWTNVSGKGINLLDLLYSDIDRWGFLFNQYVMLTKLEHYDQMKKRISAPINFTERSLLSDKNIFMKNFVKQNQQTQAEALVYEEWFNFITKKVDYNIDALVYLRCKPQTCFERCQKRSRKEESSIPLEYLEQIHERHEEWLINTEKKLDLPLLIIDTDEGNNLIQDFEHNPEKAQQIVQQIQKFIQNISN